jgi:hypothetical protein
MTSFASFKSFAGKNKFLTPEELELAWRAHYLKQWKDPKLELAKAMQAEAEVELARKVAAEAEAVAEAEAEAVAKAEAEAVAKAVAYHKKIEKKIANQSHDTRDCNRRCKGRLCKKSTKIDNWG